MSLSIPITSNPDCAKYMTDSDPINPPAPLITATGIQILDDDPNELVRPVASLSPPSPRLRRLRRTRFPSDIVPVPRTRCAADGVTRRPPAASRDRSQPSDHFRHKTSLAPGVIVTIQKAPLAKVDLDPVGRKQLLDDCPYPATMHHAGGPIRNDPVSPGLVIFGDSPQNQSLLRQARREPYHSSSQTVSCRRR